MSATPIPLGKSSAGRLSGKSWKTSKSPTVYAFLTNRIGFAALHLTIFHNTHRRSHLPVGVKSKSWEERKKKDTKLVAVKALEKELKDEKQAEIQRCEQVSNLFKKSFLNDIKICRKRDITKERRERVEEKKRLEEMKAKVRHLLQHFLRHLLFTDVS